MAGKEGYRAILASHSWVAGYWVLLVLVIAWLYWPFLSGEVPAFRDAFHFYYPLEVWLAERADAGQLVPHFNPYDGTGTNLIGETSSGLCYPGRALWWISSLAVAQRFAVVLLVHTLIAAAGAAYAARRMGLSPAARCLAATAYALGGAVLFQHVNPVYLIGAAWTPWLFAECWALAHQSTPSLGQQREGPTASYGAGPQPRMAVWVAAAALMMLGGDPQATANAGIVALLAILARLIASGSWLFFARQLAWLGCAVLLVAGLTAVQSLPARHWLAHSLRVASHPATDPTAQEAIDDVPRLLRPLAASDRQASSAPGAAAERGLEGRYRFSVAPWHLLTLVWGTAGGNFLPENTRWLQVLAAEPPTWTASLSIGLLPALWALASWTRRETRRGQRFLIAVAAIAGLAMLGNYAPVWLLRQACHAVGADAWSRNLPGDEVGGVYWMFTQIVPGYAAFRYPAKWSVWFACALALSAATALDRRDMSTRTLRRLCEFVAALSAAAALAIVGLYALPVGKHAQVAFTNWLVAAPPDGWLGRPDAQAVLQLWLQGALIAAAIATTVALCLRLQSHAPRLRALVLLLTLGELAWAGNHWLVAVDVDRINANELAPLAESNRGAQDSAGPLFERLWAGTARADVESWQVEYADPSQPDPSQAEREHVERVCGYQMVYRLGKLHLLGPEQANLSAFLSLTPRSLSAVRHLLAQADDHRADNPELDEALAWLGVTQRLVSDEQPTWQAVPEARPIVQLLTAAEASADRPAASSLSVESFEPERLRIQVSSPHPSQLVVRLLQDGGWTAKLWPRDGSAAEQADLEQVPASTHLGLFQSLSVPGGDWTVELSYCAPGWRMGLAISLSTLALSVVVFLTQRRRERDAEGAGKRTAGVGGASCVLK